MIINRFFFLMLYNFNINNATMIRYTHHNIIITEILKSIIISSFI